MIKVDDTAITDSDGFFVEVAKHKIGDVLKLIAKSGDGEKEASVKLTTARHFRGSRPGPVKPARPEAETKALQAEFNAKMRESLEKEESQLSPEDMKKFGSPQEFQHFMNEFKKGLKPEELEKLAKIGRPSSQQHRQVKPGSYDPLQPAPVQEPFMREVLTAFRPSVAHASPSTFLVFRGTEWRSLCTVVHGRRLCRDQGQRD